MTLVGRTSVQLFMALQLPATHCSLGFFRTLFLNKMHLFNFHPLEKETWYEQRVAVRQSNERKKTVRNVISFTGEGHKLPFERSDFMSKLLGKKVGDGSQGDANDYVLLVGPCRKTQESGSFSAPQATASTKNTRVHGGCHFVKTYTR